MKHGGVEWNKEGPLNIDDFSVNLNPLGTPELVRELIEEAVRKRVYEYYPGNIRGIKEFIAELYNVDVDLVGVFNGSSEAIRLLKPCDVPEPNFSEYPRKRSYLAVERDHNYEYHLVGDCVITSNPVNPTGSYIKEEEVLNFLSSGKELILDESFTDISLVNSYIKYTEEYPNLLIISTFTKSLSIPGLRIGFTIGKKSRELEEKAPPWRINSITYYVFINLDVKYIRDFLNKSRNIVKELIEEVKKENKCFKIYETFAPFFLAEFSIPSEKLNEILRSYNFQIRDSGGFIGLRPTHGRISLKKNVRNLIKVINHVLKCEKLY